MYVYYSLLLIFVCSATLSRVYSDGPVCSICPERSNRAENLLLIHLIIISIIMFHIEILLGVLSFSSACIQISHTNVCKNGTLSINESFWYERCVLERQLTPAC